VSPPNKTPVRIAERPPDVVPGNGHTSFADSASVESRRVEWMRLLWSERRFLRKVSIWGLVLSVVVAFLLPVRYESKTRLMPPDQQSGSGLAMLAAIAGRGAGGSGTGGGMAGALGGGLGGVAGDLLGLKSSGSLFVDMLQGATVQDRLVQKFDLRSIYGDKYWEDARKDLAKSTNVKEDRKSGVISITVTDHDAQRAQQMSQAYVDALNATVAQVSTSSARRERIFLEDRLKAVRQNLDNASQQFSEYASKNGTFDVPEQAKAMANSEATLQGQLIAAESELEGLRQIYTDSNVRVKTLEARIGSLRHQIETMSGNRADLTADSGIAGDFPSIRKLPLVGVRWFNLYRENRIQETIYELLTQEYEMAKVQEAKEIPSVNVLDPPLLPEKKSFPPRIVITVAGTFLAFALGCMLVLGSAEWARNDSAEKQLATEIWGDIAKNSAPADVLHRFWSKMGGRNGSHGKAA